MAFLLDVGYAILLAGGPIVLLAGRKAKGDGSLEGLPRRGEVGARGSKASHLEATSLDILGGAELFFGKRVLRNRQKGQPAS